jgi:hypothetical protein
MKRLLVSDYINVLGPYLPKTLISSENLEHIQTIARLLPGGLTRFFGFECRLGVETAQSDFLLSVSNINHERDILRGNYPGFELPATFWTEPIWCQTRDFCVNWADPATVLHEKAENVWLEFDVNGQPPPVPTPSLFLGTKEIQAVHHNDFEPYSWLSKSALYFLTGSYLPEPVEHQLWEAIRLLPAGASIFQIGAMVARQPVFVRICIRIKPDQIIPYLKRIGWPGDVGQFEMLLNELVNLVDHVDLDIDISDRIGPKIGLESSFDYRRGPKTQPRWYDFLDYLCNKGLCLPQKRQGLIDYPGFAHEKSHEKIWPEPLIIASAWMAHNYLSLIRWGLYHVKVVYQADQPVEAKAYLHVNHLWLPRRKTQVTLSQIEELEER